MDSPAYPQAGPLIASPGRLVLQRGFVIFFFTPFVNQRGAGVSQLDEVLPQFLFYSADRIAHRPDGRFELFNSYTKPLRPIFSLVIFADIDMVVIGEAW
jgi:hypothetical protein